MSDLSSLPSALLPAGIRSRFIDDINGLRMHILEAGDDARPLVLLLHGFPELAYSWRRVMPQLAAAGFRVIAPDQRGYGRTTGWSDAYDQDLAPFSMPSLAADARTLVAALGYEKAIVIGHDFGSPVSAWCALLYPEVFSAVAMMSAPFAGPPLSSAGSNDFVARLGEAMARLPRPRKHYHAYYATREANPDMWRPPQGLHAFLRAYFHHKSADWTANEPAPLRGWTADELARLPTYYVMDLAEGMAATVAREMPAHAEVAANQWLPEHELKVYSDEYRRTGFQGGLQWYRVRTSGLLDAELQVFSGRTIDVPATFIAGRSDWGIHQTPGALERMQKLACPRMQDIHLVAGAGHWVQQEQPAEVNRLLTTFLKGLS